MEEQKDVYLLSCYLKKWSYTENKLTLNYSFCWDGHYQRRHKEFRLGNPVAMTSELLEQIVKDARYILSQSDEEKRWHINIVNYNDAKPKTIAFFSKIVKEFKNNKRSNGKSRMITARSLDFFYHDHDYDKLPENMKFFVHLNRGMNKVNGELWANALVDFKIAQKMNPESTVLNKFMSMAYSKLGEFDKAIRPMELYARAEPSIASLTALAQAYIHLEEFEKADAIYQQIADNYEEKELALFGRAHLAYKQGKDYLPFLEELFEHDPNWLQEKLKSDWEYKLMPAKKRTVTRWNASTAARYMGFERPFDLTRKAFSHEIPCYFDHEKGTVHFVKEELDCWIDLRNHFNLDGATYQVYEDKLLPGERPVSA